MSSLIWEKGRPMDARVRNLTVGEDPLLDQELLGCDLLGSLAHVHMLGEMGHLSPAVVAALKSGLGQLLDRYERGEFQVGDHEDGHSAIEAELSSLLGDAGRSVHLGRSRNDQVALALRLWMRHAMLEMMVD